MGLGLWLSASSARQLLCRTRRRGWCDWLAESGLVPFTFNGFPYGDFHQRVVKHQVYHPTWFHPDRLLYTLDLIDIQHGLLPAARGEHLHASHRLGNASPSDGELSRRRRRFARSPPGWPGGGGTGRFMCLCLEPGPGCVRQRSGDLVRFSNASC